METPSVESRPRKQSSKEDRDYMGFDASIVEMNGIGPTTI
jgi:hypothetical protein